MKRSTLGVYILLLAFLTALPLSAQTRAVPGGSDAGRGVSTSVAAPTTSSSPSSGTASSYSYSGRGSYSPAPIGNRGISSVVTYGPIYLDGSLRGTSFYSTDLYNSWNNYFYYLCTYYNISPFYFNRFARNREPLVTPAMLKLTLRRPLFVSTQILTMIDQLETMFRDHIAGKTVDKEDLKSKARDIRTLAKVIRQDPTLSMVDIRKETALNKDANDEMLSLESISRLREMALDLNRQLTEMLSQSSSSTVSVESYKQPSFESLTKGIERTCKAIESSSKRL